MTSNVLQWLSDWLLSANWIQLCSRVPILMIYQGHQGLPPESVIKPNCFLSLLHGRHQISYPASKFRVLLAILTTFWSIGLDDHWSKKIYRPQMIVDVRCFIYLIWSCFQFSSCHLLQELIQTSLRKGQLKDIITETCKLDVLFKIASKAIRCKSGLLTKQTDFKIYPRGTMKLCSEQSITIMKIQIQIHPTVWKNTPPQEVVGGSK